MNHISICIYVYLKFLFNCFFIIFFSCFCCTSFLLLIRLNILVSSVQIFYNFFLFYTVSIYTKDTISSQKNINRKSKIFHLLFICDFKMFPLYSLIKSHNFLIQMLLFFFTVDNSKTKIYNLENHLLTLKYTADCHKNLYHLCSFYIKQ